MGIENIEIIGGIVAILAAMYGWVKKPVEDIKTIVSVHENKHETSEKEVTRLRDGLHDARNKLQEHETRITHLEEKD